VVTFGHRVKCEDTLVFIVIHGHNVSKTLTMRSKCEHHAHNATEILACGHNVSTMLRMRYACGAHITVNCSRYGKK